MIDLSYQEIIDNLEEDKVLQLLIDLGADEIIDQPNQIITNTICHNPIAAEASLKLYYYKDNKFFYCYTEDGGMSIFTFLKNYYETRELNYDWYNDVYLVAKSCAISFETNLSQPVLPGLRDLYKTINRDTNLPVYPKGALSVFSHHYPVEWLDDGISESTLDKFNILFSYDQHKIIIPHYNIDGELVGIRGRTLDEWEEENLGKYMPVKIEGKWYSHPLSLNLYGLNKTRDAIAETRQVIVFEGEKSVLQMEGFSLPNNSVAVCGANFNKFHLDILMKYFNLNEIVLAFDNEDQKNQSKHFNRLMKIAKKYTNYVNWSFIYDFNQISDYKSSPSDGGEEIFRELLKTRVKVS